MLHPADERELARLAWDYEGAFDVAVLDSGPGAWTAKPLYDDGELVRAHSPEALRELMRERYSARIR